MFRSLCTTLLTLFVVSLACAQGNLELGVNFGGSLYNGDLSPAFNRDYPKFIEPAAGVFLRTDFSRRLSGRLHFHQTRLRGNDIETGRNFRNLNFRNNISELAAMIEFNFLNINSSNGPIQFFVEGGLAAFHHNPKTFYQGTYIELQQLGTEGQGIPGFPDNYNKLQYAIPGGGGIKIPVGPSAKITLEAAARKLFFDYIDDVGTGIVSYDELLAGNGELATILHDRTFELVGEEPGPFPTGARGGDFDDWYYIFSVGVSWNLTVTSSGGNARCPKF